MPSLSAEERQLLDNSLQDFLAKNYSFERWKKLARGPEMESFGRAEWAQYAELGCNYLILQDILPPRFFVGILEGNI
jgi:hypothetical protein